MFWFLFVIVAGAHFAALLKIPFLYLKGHNIECTYNMLMPYINLICDFFKTAPKLRVVLHMTTLN